MELEWAMVLESESALELGPESVLVLVLVLASALVPMLAWVMVLASAMIVVLAERYRMLRPRHRRSRLKEQDLIKLLPPRLF